MSVHDDHIPGLSNVAISAIDASGELYSTSPSFSAGISAYSMDATTLPAEVVKFDKDGVLTIDGINVNEFLKTVGERMLILEADFKKHEEYPALKDLYDQYKMMEKLLMENKDK